MPWSSLAWSSLAWSRRHLRCQGHRAGRRGSEWGSWSARRSARLWYAIGCGGGCAIRSGTSSAGCPLGHIWWSAPWPVRIGARISSSVRISGRPWRPWEPPGAPWLAPGEPRRTGRLGDQTLAAPDRRAGRPVVGRPVVGRPVVGRPVVGRPGARGLGARGPRARRCSAARCADNRVPSVGKPCTARSLPVLPVLQRVRAHRDQYAWTVARTRSGDLAAAALPPVPPRWI
jgi:hypothetical protein